MTRRARRACAGLGAGRPRSAHRRAARGCAIHADAHAHRAAPRATLASGPRGAPSAAGADHGHRLCLAPRPHPHRLRGRAVQTRWVQPASRGSGAAGDLRRHGGDRPQPCRRRPGRPRWTACCDRARYGQVRAVTSANSGADSQPTVPQRSPALLGGGRSRCPLLWQSVNVPALALLPPTHVRRALRAEP